MSSERYFDGGLEMYKVWSISFEIAPSNEDAARLVMNWRNDAETLANSFNQEQKMWPEFFDEYREFYVKDPTTPCFFACADGRRVGFVRFRKVVDGQLNASGGLVDVSINIDPQLRKKGLGTAVLIAVTNQLGGTLRTMGIYELLAEIKLDNVHSQKAFESAGFKFISEASHLLASGVSVPVKQFRLQLVQKIENQTFRIGKGYPCFVIAEAGSNWRMGSLARDLKMGKTLIDVAKEAGCDAVKFQTYRPETTYVKNAGESDYLASNGIKQDISEIFKDLAMPYEMLSELQEHSKQNEIAFMSSPFSIADLEEVDKFTSLHKIASYEITHVRLIEAAARTKKPVIFSTGASTTDDIEYALTLFRSISDSPVALMQCTAKYPSPISALNLRVIPFLKKLFGVPVGLSDHSRHPVVGPLAAVALGADLIEKHYTLSNDLPGPDHKFALTPDELKEMVQAVRGATEARGNGIKNIQDEEKELFYFARRAVQAIENIGSGESFVEGKNFEILRPGKQKPGMNPRYINQLQGAVSSREIQLGEGIHIEDVRRD